MHVEAGKIARTLLNDQIFPELYTLLNNYKGEFYSGCIFPDWSLGGLISGDAAYRAHSPAFHQTYLNRIKATYPDLNSHSAKREFAFYLGVRAHYFSDRIFHGSNGEHSVLIEGMVRDATTEDIIEGMLDICIAHEFTNESFSWFWPNSTLLAAYHDFGDTGITLSQLQTGENALQVAYSASVTSSSWQYSVARATIPWTYANYRNYYSGGLYNCAHLNAQQIRKEWALPYKRAYVFQRTQYNCGYTATSDVHLLYSFPTHNTGGENRLIALVDFSEGHGATLLKWTIQGVSPDSVSLDSAKVFMFYSERWFTLTGNKVLSAYAINKDWREGSLTDGEADSYNGAPASPGQNIACWTHAKYNSLPWSIPGVGSAPSDRDATPLSQIVINNSTTFPRWLGWHIARIPERWILSPASNYGVVLFEEPNTFSGLVLFVSGEAKEISYHPMLVLYTSPGVLAVEEIEITHEREFFVSPSPFRYECYIELPSSKKAIGMEVFDISGRRIAHFDDNTISKNRLVWRPQDEINSGVYLIKVILEDRAVNFKTVYLK